MFRSWQKVTINTPNGTVEGIAPIIISARTTYQYRGATAGYDYSEYCSVSETSRTQELNSSYKVATTSYDGKAWRTIASTNTQNQERIKAEDFWHK
jgi:hypothetical protein